MTGPLDPVGSPPAAAGLVTGPLDPVGSPPAAAAPTGPRVTPPVLVPPEWEHQKMHHTLHLALFLGGSDDSFTGDLLRLIAKADPGNRALLRRAFPLAVQAWELWMTADPVPTFGELAALLDFYEEARRG